MKVEKRETEPALLKMDNKIMKILINISLMTIQVYSSSLISCLFEYAYDGRNCISRLYGEWSAEDIREVKGGDYI